MTLDFLIVLNIATPIICIYVFSYNKNGIKLDHVFLVSAGYLYFWVVPLTVFHYNLFSYIIKEKDFANMFEIKNIVLSETDKSNYLLCIICIYLSFIFGEKISRNIRYTKYRIKYFSIKPLDYILYIYVILLIILTIMTRENYFKGYKGGYFALQGNVIALNLMLLVLLYLYFFNTDKHHRYINIFTNRFFIVYLISTILLASLGNRTWLICGILSFFVLYTNYYRRISLLFTLIGFTALIFILGLLVVARTGQWNWLSTEVALYLAFFDPFASHNGLKYFLTHNELHLINFPIVLISKIFNIIPSVIMPNKEILYYTYKEIGADIIAIQASSHTFTLLITHFGLIGIIIIAFTIPFALNYFKQSIILSGIYIFTVTHMAAPFFRDFDNFTIKILFQFGIIMPIIFLFLCGIYRKNKSRYNNYTQRISN